MLTRDQAVEALRRRGIDPARISDEELDSLRRATAACAEAVIETWRRREKAVN